MSPFSSELKDRSRKNQASILQALAKTGQQGVADCLGTSVSTISRWQSSEGTSMGLQAIATLLAAVGLKAVPIEMKCFPVKQVEALLELARARLDQLESAESMLDFED